MKKSLIGGFMKKVYFLSLIILIFSLNGQMALSQAPYNNVLGTKGYVEFVEGNMPFVISIPHDGTLRPEDIPERPCLRCSKNQDIYTIEIAKAIREHIYENTGFYPYLIISHLHRSKLDPNRNIQLAATGHKQAEIAWTEFHNFIDSAITEVEQKFGKGIYIWRCISYMSIVTHMIISRCIKKYEQQIFPDHRIFKFI